MLKEEKHFVLKYIFNFNLGGEGGLLHYSTQKINEFLIWIEADSLEAVQLDKIDSVK